VSLVAVADVRALYGAIAAAPSGTTVKLASGRYELPTPLLLQRSVRLEGDGNVVLDGRGRSGLVRAMGARQVYGFDGVTFEAAAGYTGGALVASSGSALYFHGCRFLGNRAGTGAAAALRDVRATFRRCTFERNRAPLGGALAVGQGAEVALDRCIFVANEADSGGALFATDASAIVLEGCTFVANQAHRIRGGHAIFAAGAAGRGPSVQASNCVFSETDAVATEPGTGSAVSLSRCVLPTLPFDQGVIDMGANTRSAAGRAGLDAR
jgi:Right handed beta helix region